MNTKEKVFLGTGLGIVLLGSVSVYEHLMADDEVFRPPLSNQPHSNCLPEGLSSQQAICEQGINQKTVDGVIAFMQNTGNEKITVAAQRLRELSLQGILTVEQLSKNGQSPQVRLYVAEDQRSTLFKIIVPEDFLQRADISEVDLTVYLYNQRIIYETVRDWKGGQRSWFFTEKEAIEADAWKQTAEDIFWVLGDQLTNPELIQRYLQFLGQVGTSP